MKSKLSLLFLVSLTFSITGCGMPTGKAPTTANFTLSKDISYNTALNYHSPEKQDAVLKTVPENVKSMLDSDHTALLKYAQKKYNSAGIKDYVCTFSKQETIKDKLRKKQVSRVRFRRKPFSLVMLIKEGADLSDRIFYQEGKNIDPKTKRSMMLARVDILGMKSTHKKLPDDSMVMSRTLKPCTEFGFNNSFKNLISVYEQAKAKGEVKEFFAGTTTVDGRDCIVLARVLKKSPDYPAYITETCLDAKTLLPIRIVGYDWNKNFSTNYEFSKLKLNANLNDSHFNPKRYGF